MKTLFITYEQNGSVKKANINEQRYIELQSDNTVSNIVIYPTQFLQESNYNQIVNGLGGNKRIILD